MLGFMDREQLRRSIAEAGLLCIGVGTICAAGCAGTSRDSLTAAAGSTKGETQQVAADETPGRASLSDRSTASKPKRRIGPSPEMARQVRQQAPTQPAGDPFLAEAAARQLAARNQAARTPVPSVNPQPGTFPVQHGPSQDEIDSRPLASRRIPARTAQDQSPVGNDRGNIAQVASRTTSRPQATANDRAAVAQVGATSRVIQRPIAQTTTTKRIEPRRPKAPVITPAIPDSDSLSSHTDGAIDNGYERQRADRLMARAHDMLSHNFREEAMRLASVAVELEKSKQALYAPGEERPSEFLARLQPVGTIPDTDSASRIEQASETVKKPAQRPRSRPAKPMAIGSKHGRAELTDIRAGWQAPSDNSGSAKVETKTTPRLPQPDEAAPQFDGENAAANGGTSAANSGHAEVALLAAPRSADSHVTTADATSPTLNPVGEESTSGPSLAMIDAPAAPEVLDSKRYSAGEYDSSLDVAIEDIAEAQPIIDEPAARSRWSAMSIGGLAAGFIGLVGLVYWRRQEQKHYAAAGR